MRKANAVVASMQLEQSRVITNLIAGGSVVLAASTMADLYVSRPNESKHIQKLVEHKLTGSALAEFRGLVESILE